MRTFAIIPVRSEWHLTERVLENLAGEPVNDVLVMDNGSTDGTLKRLRAMQRRDDRWRGRLHAVDLAGSTIYQMWNYGARRAKRLTPKQGSIAPPSTNLLVLNNDIALPDGWVTQLTISLRDAPGDVWCVYPDANASWGAQHSHHTLTLTRGVYGDGGMFGPCFMLALEKLPWEPLITDDGYRWWYGDNHLAECIEQEGGKQARVDDLPVRHENEGTARHHDLDDQKWQDRHHWLNRSLRAPRAIDRRY